MTAQQRAQCFLSTLYYCFVSVAALRYKTVKQLFFPSGCRMAKKKRSRNLGLPASLDSIKSALAPFIDSHPQSSVDTVRIDSQPRLVIQKPWGDRSIMLVFLKEPTALIDALNNLILPRRLTALWHRDTRSLEVLWTAYKPPKTINDVFGREFSLLHNGTEYRCRFSKSSERVLTIADNFIPVAATDTGYRNLPSFQQYVRLVREDQAAETSPRNVFGEPTSFWISPIDWNEDEVLQLVPMLNFYMTHFDSLTPRIELHTPDERAQVAQTRYISGNFPKQIQAAEIDDNLLHFWDAAQTGDSARRFIYYYRILEYASFSYLEAPARLAVRKLLAAPNAGDRIADLVDDIVSIVQGTKLDEYARFQALIADTCDAKLLCKEMRLNLPTFSEELRFDGGFVVRPVLTANSTDDDFAKTGINNFCSTIRNIRNALSHGRDQKTSSVIAPTAKNFERLRPWLPVMSIAAAQTMIMNRVL